MRKLIVLYWLISVGLLVALFVATPALSQQLKVTRIVDGDTFELSDEQQVRLIGIDTPEGHASSKLNRMPNAATKTRPRSARWAGWPANMPGEGVREQLHCGEQNL